MNRTEMLASYLQVLEEINDSTRLALETLNKNAETTRMIIDELINGACEAPSYVTESITKEMESFFGEEIQEIAPETEAAETADSLADKIVQEIRKADAEGHEGVRALSIAIDPDKFNPFEVMDLVQKKMEKEDQDRKSEEKEEENIHDEIKFDFDF
jgi:hypothetical protein